MRENRYFFYLVSLNMLTNVTMFVPHVLIEERFRGGMSSAVASVLIGMTLLILFTMQLKKIDHFTLPKVLQNAYPTWFRVPYTVLLGLFWMTAGATSLISYTEMTRRFLSPETSSMLILGILLLLVVGVSYMESDLLMYGVEVVFIVVVPLVVFLLGKSLFSKTMNWIEVTDVITHTWNAPSLKGIGATTYVFSGYTNMLIFSRSFPARLRKIHYLIMGLLGFSIIMTSFLIPIGFLGSYSVEHYSFPWVATADAMRMEFFFIERVLGPFLILYLALSTISTIVHWHVGCQLFDSLFSMPKKRRRQIVLGVFFLLTLALQKVLGNEHEMYSFATRWLTFRLFAEISLVAVVMYGVRRWKKSS
ncbi:GerAB/ArcD/ProY family transporter [Tumebacillus sp. ITR2]|uniref:GerAB/ArcD/ProY family transporter n=1 Tax=Tumebacillus amylolyticus TaxID=2801339 RepID=A0ABS1JEY8_9BACL|nr:GerAB/ArcD/ProY family transporter [Tumebacillus amylolyticus]